MPRGKPSAADTQLLDALASLGMHATSYQLERWRLGGFMPRNVRRSLGRGRGSESEPALDAFACAQALARFSAQGASPARRIAERFYGLSSESPDRARSLPERVVRTSLRSLLEEDRVPAAKSEDAAYQEAFEIAAKDRWILRGSDMAFFHGEPAVPARSMREARAAYEHVLAAQRLGVYAVGVEIIQEALVTMGWVPGHGAVEATAYLALVLNNTDQLCQAVDRTAYRHLCETASIAARLHSMAVFSMAALIGTGFEWLPRLHTNLVRHSAVHAAILMDSQMEAAGRALTRSPGG